MMPEKVVVSAPLLTVASPRRGHLPRHQSRAGEPAHRVVAGLEVECAARVDGHVRGVSPSKQ